VAAGEVDEVYQDDELPCSFNIDPNSALNSLLSDVNDVTVPEQRKQALRKKRSVRYWTFFIFHIIFLLYHIAFFIFLSYHVFDEYSLVLVLNNMSKKLKSAVKKLFGGKSWAGMVDTLFHDPSTTTSQWAEIMKHIDPSLVGRTVCFQRDEAILLFSYHFAIWIYWFLFIPFFRMRRVWGNKRRWSMRVGVGLRGWGLEESSDGGHDKEEERHEEGHEDSAGLDDKWVGVMGLLQDLHPHTDLGGATSFTLL
jgi:hypothetical protein